MRPLIVLRGSLILAMLLLGPSARADGFVDFFYKQKVGQELSLTGHFSRGFKQQQFFERDFKTGEVEYFKYSGTFISPTTIIGNGSLTWPPRSLETVLMLYPDERLVKDLPEQGENVWFTGTLIGYQYGLSGITSDVSAGGVPFILLKRVSTEPPDS
jgi:hypothetical protein